MVEIIRGSSNEFVGVGESVIIEVEGGGATVRIGSALYAIKEAALGGVDGNVGLEGTPISIGGVGELVPVFALEAFAALNEIKVIGLGREC